MHLPLPKYKKGVDIATNREIYQKPNAPAVFG